MIEPSQETFAQGCVDAQQDINAGQPKLLWSVRGPGVDFAEELFRTRFGITLEKITCFVWPDLINHRRRLDYRRGYNQTIAAHLDATHGAGTYRQAEEEVVRFRREQYAAALEKERRASEVVLGNHRAVA